MPSIKPFDITLSDINFLLDQMRDAIIITHYDATGEAIYGFMDSDGATHDLGTFGNFTQNGDPVDPLGIIDPVTGLSIYDGAREASGFRIPIGFFNNLVDFSRWTWGATDNPFPRLTVADYNNYVAQVSLNPALTNSENTGWLQTHTLTDTTVLAESGLGGDTTYGDLNKTIVDYTPRMITQMISSSYGAPGAATAAGTGTYALTDAAGGVINPGLLIVSTGSGLVAFQFYNGQFQADPTQSNLVGVDIRAGRTMAQVVSAMQAGLQASTGDTDATVGLDANGHLAISLGNPQAGSIAIFDYANLGLGGIFDPVIDENASAMIRMGVYTDVVTSENVIGVNGLETITEYMVRNLNTLPGDPSTSGIFTLFGQFFDHGLDFINKGGQGSKIIIPLSPDDPLYRAPGTNGPADPGNSTITISRATPDGYTVDDYHGRPLSIAGADNMWNTADDLSAPGADGVYGTADDVHAPVAAPTGPTTYTNHTSPFIDQSQSYGSDTQTTYILREWVEDPNNPGTYIPGMELFDGHVTQDYHSTTFNDLSADGLNATGDLTAGTTTRTLPTLNELREHLRDTMRDDLTWDDINNLRARDDQGHVIDANGAAAAGGFTYTGEALLLDINPRFDEGRLHPNDGNATTDFDSNEGARVDAAIALMNRHMADVGRGGDVLSFGINPATNQSELKLHLGSDLNMGPGGTLPAGMDLYGAYALAPWVNFANFSIAENASDIIFDESLDHPEAMSFYNAVGEIMMASIGDHYVAGDGRANENFGLTAIHHVFHANHNVQLVNLEKMVLAAPDVDARHGYQTAVSDGADGYFHDKDGNYTLTDQSSVQTASIDQISWNQDKMFEGAKLINEMEYQHVAIDQYARLVTPDLPEFVTYDNDIQSDISLEYSQAAFRFGHSQLRETIDTIDPNGLVTKWALEAAFLNPTAYANTGAENILRGMSQQLTNEVDEFVTPAMQQTLLGQPLDLAAINIARGRDVGMPTLNQVRAQLHQALVDERLADPTTPHHTNLIVDALNPYTSWAEFNSQMQHPESIVDFVAAYAFDGDLDKAQELVDLESGAIASSSGAMGWTVQDAVGFFNNSYSGGDASLLAGQHTFDNIDFWIGGLAELHVFTGQLGTTFNAIFEDQMERLMDGDRFYYLYRLGLALPIDPDLGHAITTEQFKDIIERTTGALHLNGDVMGWSDHTFELYKNASPIVAIAGESIHDETGATVAAVGGEIKYQLDPSTNTWVAITNFAAEEAYKQIVDRHATDVNGIDAFSSTVNHGVGIYSGSGSGIAGDGTMLTKSNTDLGITRQYIADFRPDIGENPDGTPSSGYNSHETFAGTDYDDWLDAGNGDDTIYGDKGDDVLDGKAGADHIYGGDGQDVIYGGDIEDFLDGGAGDDIIYAGTSAGALDVAIGGHGNDRIYGEAGIDELYGGEGDDYIDAGGDTDLAFGDAGNDIMFGGDGPDELRGGEGDDMLSGGSGSDQLKGEHGDDIFFGGIGQAAQTGDSDENLGDTGFDIAAFSDTSIKLDTAADLRNLNLTGAPGGTAFEPFNQLWTDLEGVIGSKFDDTIIGADNTGTVDAEGVNSGDNWLIGGGGNDTFNKRTPDSNGSVGGSGFDVIIGDKIRLDTLIGAYAGYDHSQKDANGNIIHSYSGTLGDGLLDNAALGTEMFAKHFTEMLKTEDRKDLVLGGDSGSAGTSDVAIFTGNKADYSIDIISHDFGNADGLVTAYKITDNRDPNATDANGVVIPTDGTDLVVGVEVLRFVDGDIHLPLVAPTLDLTGDHTVTTTTNGQYRDNFTNAAFDNSDGTTAWSSTPWQETGDNGSPTGGQITIDNGNNNVLRFGDNGDGAAIQRTVGLAGVTSATVSYSYNENSFDTGETVSVQFSDDGSFGAGHLQTIQTIQTINGSSSSGNTSNVALNGVLSANSAIRFVVAGTNNNSSSDAVTIDNLRIDTATTASTNIAGAPGNDYATSYTEGISRVGISSFSSITDDGTTLASAKVVVTNAVAGDLLRIGNSNASSGNLGGGVSYSVTSNGGQVILAISGSASLGQYQNWIDQVRFYSTSNNPTNADRLIHVTVNDGMINSNVATTTIHVTPVNDPPSAGTDYVVTNQSTSGSPASFNAAWLLANDTDTDGPNALSVTGLSGQSGLSATLNSGVVSTYNITGNNDRFNYTVTDGQSSSSGQVNVSFATGTTISGNDGFLGLVPRNEILVGGSGNETLDGNRGDDIILAGGGDDTVVWNATTFFGIDVLDGHDIVDGGANGPTGDRFVVTGNNTAETFAIYSNTDHWDGNISSVSSAVHAGFTGLNVNTEIVVTRNGTIIAELDNVEEITINTLDTTANNGNGGPDGGTSGGDTIQVVGNFTGTSLNYSTITVNGSDGDDTVDISGLTSDHRIVFHGAGGTNHVIGDLRPQDVVDNVAPGNGNAPGNGGGTSQGDDDDDDNEHQNRAPVVNGPIVLPSLAVNTPMLIAAAMLLAGASDADGDSLTVTNLTPSSGSVTQGPDGWTFTPDTDDSSQVSFTYDISDGHASVHQTASLDLVAVAAEGEGTDAPVSGGDAHLGTDGDDVMIGGPDADVLSGGQGDDVILGNDGADTLLGGAGDDLIKAGAGDDVVFGGAGNDIIFGGDGHDMLFGDAGDDRIFGDAGNDTIEGGAGNDTVYGGSGDDRIIANVGDGDDVYWGEDGQDTLDYAAISASLTIDLGNGLLHHGSVSSAQTGHDTMFGFENMIAGSGDDTIIANDAANIMDGGLGSDTFVFGSAADANGDTIVGLQPGDKIDLSMIDADTSAAGHQSFVLFAGAGFTSAGQVMVSYQMAADGEHTLVSGEINGDGAADFGIDVAGHHDLDETSFKFA
ncbi:peroxidase family protein [Mesorhizobium sp. ES1-4]|uniref:peroxidase family protein n=1 Tax=Mesorhizobium sp. ES1-4 TaxID=2876627 RepID=UPI001CCC4200|nr:peroxidase family protein [Mesorhizobium sp. ES1-4]MBZ9799559.1 cadherin-like domain-containing protein [Mesorhizobium sp. ES1-4]